MSPIPLPIRRLALLVIASSLLLFFWMVRGVALPVFVSTLFAILLYPLLTRLEKRLGKRAALAPVLVTAGSILVVFLPLSFVVFMAIRSVRTFFSSDFDQKIVDISDWVVRQLVRLGGLLQTVGLETSPEKLRETLVTSAQEGGKKLAEILGGLAYGTPQLVLASFLFVIGLYFSLRDGKAVARRLSALLPFSALDVDALFSSVHATVKGAILGSALTGAVQSGLCIVVLFILGVPGPFVWGTFAFLLSFIPMFGTAPVTAGATIYLFATGHPVSGIVMGASGVLIGLSDNIVRPWVQGSQDDMHPLIALIAIFGGLEVFGFAGVFIGPVVAACALWALDVYGRSKRAIPREALDPTEQLTRSSASPRLL
ncbi:MAG: AI-2E family transporter [Deltaproteobacteria bacterium]|nr:AI-2E family transporter [Deltaproteobacteria bacterium]